MVRGSRLLRSAVLASVCTCTSHWNESGVAVGAVDTLQTKMDKMLAHMRNLTELPHCDPYEMGFQREALIICDLTRPGSWPDLKIMCQLCEDYGFSCKVEGKPTLQRVMKDLEEFRAKLSYGFVSCFILVIMGHGRHGFVSLLPHGNEAAPQLELEWVFQMFNNQQCPAMVGKPKLFIVQACREDNVHYSSVYCDASVCSGPVCKPRRLPTLSDYLIVYPCQPGTSAFRNPDHGSPLFKELAKAADEFGKTHDVVEILTKVTERLKARERRDWAFVGVHDYKENSLHMLYNLSRKWYLFNRL